MNVGLFSDAEFAIVTASESWLGRLLQQRAA
jgi:hypothetical protein